jgi:tripartite-type tricarboxylate transporter receptor subunit TctC
VFTLISWLCAAAFAIASSGAAAQAYPAKPIKLVVTLSAGSTSDILARSVAEAMSTSMGQPIIIENRPGMGGNIAGDYVARSPADGYTLLLATISSHAINPAIATKMPYDPIKDFEPIGLVANSPNVLVVSNSIPAKNVAELVAYLKANPRTVNYASGGVGTSHQLAAEMFNSMAGTKVQHVPYKGSPQAVAAVTTGEVAMMFPNLPNASGLASAGKLKLLAVTTPRRISLLPDVPTMAEQGFAGFDVTAWFGLMAPAATPASVTRKLNEELAKALNQKKVKDMLVAQGMEAMGGSPQAFSDFVKSEIEKWRRVAKEAHITME